MTEFDKLMAIMEKEPRREDYIHSRPAEVSPSLAVVTEKAFASTLDKLIYSSPAEVSPNLAVVTEKAPASTNETFFQKHKGKLIAGGIIGALAFLGRGE